MTRGAPSPIPSISAGGLLRRLVGQAEDDDVDLGRRGALGGRVLAQPRPAGCAARRPRRPASLSRICRPVVPASPSMKIVAVMIVSQVRKDNAVARPEASRGNERSASAESGGDHAGSLLHWRASVKRIGRRRNSSFGGKRSEAEGQDQAQGGRKPNGF